MVFFNQIIFSVFIQESVMTSNQKKRLQAAAVFSILFAIAVCSLGLIYIVLDGRINQHTFIMLGLATLGAAMAGSVAGLFLSLQPMPQKGKHDDIQSVQEE